MNTEIDFKNIDEELFGDIAENRAKKVAKPSNIKEKDRNKYTQIRMFYDDIEKLYSKSTKLEDNEFKTKILPFVKMVRSKVAYAEGRGLVSKEFVEFVTETIDEVGTHMELETCKLFWEAFMGFYKQLRPKK